MKIILNNGVELTPITVTGTKRLVQGASRDTLTFVFQDGVSLDELDDIFSAVNCESITIIDEQGNEYIHNGYVIRAELKREPIEIAPASDSEPATYESRVIVAMSRRNYNETQLLALQEAIEMLCMEDVEV